MRLAETRLKLLVWPCPRAEATDRYHQILRKIPAALDDDTRHARERFRQIDLQLVLLDLRGIDAVDGDRQIKCALLGPRRGHDDRVEVLLCFRHGSQQAGGARRARPIPVARRLALFYPVH